MKVKKLNLKDGSDRGIMSFRNCEVFWTDYIRDQLGGIEALESPSDYPTLAVKFKDSAFSDKFQTVFFNPKDIFTIEPADDDEEDNHDND